MCVETNHVKGQEDPTVTVLPADEPAVEDVSTAVTPTAIEEPVEQQETEMVKAVESSSSPKAEEEKKDEKEEEEIKRETPLLLPEVEAKETEEITKIIEVDVAQELNGKSEDEEPVDLVQDEEDDLVMEQEPVELIEDHPEVEQLSKSREEEPVEEQPSSTSSSPSALHIHLDDEDKDEHQQPMNGDWHTYDLAYNLTLTNNLIYFYQF